MITDIQTERMVVISDLHIGNPFSTSTRKVVDFLHWAADEGFDLCINGDGFEIAQVSFDRMAMDVPPLLHALKSIAQRGNRIFYVVGNHDILFEHFLEDWGTFKAAPFLNVTSGESRIRVEHGHLYDPFFVKNPELYELLTWIAGFALRLSPQVYKFWIAYEKRLSRLRLKRGETIVGENPSFTEAASELISRGFDSVVFGHTHHAGLVKIADNAFYFNPGSWMLGESYVKIEAGRVSLEKWTRPN